MINLLLSFSNNLISKGIESLLASAKDIHVHTVQEPNKLAAVINENKPDVLLVDFCVLMNSLSDMTPKIHVLLLDTGCGTNNINYAFISKNISGLIASDMDEITLAKAVRSVTKGNLWIGRKDIKNLITFLAGLKRFRNLTKREMEILCLIGRGMNEDAMSEILVLDKKTVKLYIQRIKEKSGTQNTCELEELSLYFSERDRLQNYMEFINQDGPIDFFYESLPSVQEGFTHK